MKSSRGINSSTEVAMPQLFAVNRPEIAPRPIGDRLRVQLVYFMASPGSPGVPPLGEDEYFLRLSDVERWLDEGVFQLVSPLDSANTTEVELSEEQEELFEWLKAHQVEHVRVRV
jgi:hypothetical protein